MYYVGVNWQSVIHSGPSSIVYKKVYNRDYHVFYTGRVSDMDRYRYNKAPLQRLQRRGQPLRPQMAYLSNHLVNQ